LKSDAVVEGRHFLATTPPRWIGHKALGRVLSDLAAAGGEPLWALVNLVAPPSETMQRLRGVYQGLAALARRHGLAIIGGDTTQGPVLELHLFAVGRAPRGTALLRSGARPGDTVFVTGALGGSLAGKHLRFLPRLAEGRWLCVGGWATAAIDLSDGLATDLEHILEMSRVGAEIRTEKIPIAQAAFRKVEKTNQLFTKTWNQRSPLQHALGDGEDFELLFTVPQGQATALTAAWRKKFRTRLTAIGTITNRDGEIKWLEHGRSMTLPVTGFEHFR
jgi:thiamine-monophosphate kinase